MTLQSTTSTEVNLLCIVYNEGEGYAEGAEGTYTEGAEGYAEGTEGYTEGAEGYCNQIVRANGVHRGSFKGIIFQCTSKAVLEKFHDEFGMTLYTKIYCF